jgi:hypothetical protein
MFLVDQLCLNDFFSRMPRKLFVGGMTNVCTDEDLERAFQYWDPIDGKISHDSFKKHFQLQGLAFFIKCGPISVSDQTGYSVF